MKLALLILLLGSLLIASAATYHVSTNGSDANPGSEGEPWLTVQKAANTVAAGDIVIIGAGKWVENVDTKINGHSTNRITFRGSSTNSVVSQFRVLHSYYTFDGLTLDGEGSAAFSGSFYLLPGSECVVQNCYLPRQPDNMYKFRMSDTTTGLTVSNCILAGSYTAALVLRGSGHTIVDNYWSSDVGGDALDILASSVVVRGNFFDGWGNPGLIENHCDIFQSWISTDYNHTNEWRTNVLIENNFILNQWTNDATAPIQVTDDWNEWRLSDWTFRNNIFVGLAQHCSISAPDIKFLNNLFYKTGTASGGFGLNYAPNTEAKTNAAGCAHHVTFLNNIFYILGEESQRTSTNGGWYNITADVRENITNFVSDYNLIIGEGAGTTKGIYWTYYGDNSNSLNGVDPLFTVEPPTSLASLKLLAASLAIGAGTNLSSLFTTDYSGNTRPASGGWTIGPLEYQEEEGEPLQRTGRATTFRASNVTVGTP